MPILSYTPNIIEPIEHPRAQEAKLKGLTVELLLALEKAQADAIKNLGVIIKDHKDAYLNQLTAIRNNPLELQRQKEGEVKAKENAAKVFNGVLAMGMPSTYYNLFNLDNLLSNGQALALDIGSMALLGGAGLVKLAVGRKIAQNAFKNRVAREIAENGTAKAAEKNTATLTVSNKPTTTSLAFFKRLPQLLFTNIDAQNQWKTFVKSISKENPDFMRSIWHIDNINNKSFSTGLLKDGINETYPLWVDIAPSLDGRIGSHLPTTEAIVVRIPYDSKVGKTILHSPTAASGHINYRAVQEIPLNEAQMFRFDNGNWVQFTPNVQFKSGGKLNYTKFYK